MIRSRHLLAAALALVALAVGVFTFAAAPAHADPGPAAGVWEPFQYPGPGLRQGAAVALDPLRHRLYLFGGFDGHYFLNDTWVLDLTGTPVWTEVHPRGVAPAPRAGHSLIYDPVRGRVILFGGFGPGPAPVDSTQQLWALGLGDSVRWQHLAVADSAPAARYGQAAVYVPSRDRIVVMGGSSATDTLDDTWALALSGVPAWTRLPAGATAPRLGHSLVLDVAHARLVLYGGYGGAPARGWLGDVWTCGLDDTCAWRPATPAGPAPAPRQGHAAVYDPNKAGMLVSGGSTATGCVQDLWTLRLGKTLAWDSLGVSTAAPCSRDRAAAAYDPMLGRMVVTCGSTTTGPLGDTWLLDDFFLTWGSLGAGPVLPPRETLSGVALDPVRRRLVVYGFSFPEGAKVWTLPLDGAPLWAELAVAGTPPPPLWGHTAMYDPVRDRIVYFGGAVDRTTTTVNQTWALDLSPAPMWEQLLPSGTLPDPRMGHTATYDPVRDRMIMMGGFLEAGSLTAYPGVWALTFKDSLAWVRLTISNGDIVNRTFHTAVYDPPRDRIVVFGGAEYTTYGSTWALSLGDTLTWTELLPEGSGPVNRRSHSAVIDPLRDRMIVHAGNTERYWGASGYLDDTWALNLSGPPQWTALDMGGTWPGVRAEHAGFWDPVTLRMIVFGGTRGGLPLDDTWFATWDPDPSVSVTPATPRVALAIAGVRPNPVRSTARVALALPVTGPARLEVFDLAGRLLARHDLGTLQAGPHDVAVEEAGRLPAGLYLVRIEQAGRQAVARMAVIH